MATHHEPNSLIHSTSPYLLQHAYNPVHWQPWSNTALNQAQQENKLIIVSIGYSTCHWCHVMERESFEDEEIATVMNKNFVCIKVDREERPDLDKIYMDAVQLMTGRGGWPLNCILLPDGRPIYGGTYFHKEQWRSILLHIAQLYRNDPEKCTTYAQELTEGLLKMESFRQGDSVSELIKLDWNQLFVNWSVNFDTTDGGNNHAPKFPMPNTFQWMLDYHLLQQHPYAAEHLQLTLNKMLHGGIYDQLGGGFCRYSTDMEWKVPHFEKMLYDNAQLLSIYSKAYSRFKDKNYLAVINGIFTFLSNEMKSQTGLYFAALDADTEGVEGKFYCWTLDEIKQLVPEDRFQIACDYFHFDKKGYWEEGNYIPLLNEHIDEIAAKHHITSDTLVAWMEEIKSTLLSYRNKRVRPGVDIKLITGWNGLLLTGFCDAYQFTNDKQFLNAAIELATSIIQQLIKDNQLIHSITPSEINTDSPQQEGFLDDYACVIEGLIAVYQISFDESYLLLAKQLCDSVIKQFSNEATYLFYFTSATSEKLIKRSMEIQDNVIPSSNAMMAMNLYYLSRYFDEPAYLNRAMQMIGLVQKEINNALPWYCKWAQLALFLEQPPVELVISGSQAQEWMSQIQVTYRPNLIVAIAKEDSVLPLNKNRHAAHETVAYFCKDHQCSLPIKDFGSLSALFN